MMADAFSVNLHHQRLHFARRHKSTLCVLPLGAYFDRHAYYARK